MTQKVDMLKAQVVAMSDAEPRKLLKTLAHRRRAGDRDQDQGDGALRCQPSCGTADGVPAASDPPVNAGYLRSLADSQRDRLTCVHAG